MIAASEAYAWQEWAAAALESHCCAIKIAIDTRDSVLTFAGPAAPQPLRVKAPHRTLPASRAILVPSSVACCLLHVACCLFHIVRHTSRLAARTGAPLVCQSTDDASCPARRLRSIPRTPPSKSSCVRQQRLPIPPPHTHIDLHQEWAHPSHRHWSPAALSRLSEPRARMQQHAQRGAMLHACTEHRIASTSALRLRADSADSRSRCRCGVRPQVITSYSRKETKAIRHTPEAAGAATG